MSLQLSMNFKKHIWSCPAEYKDLSAVHHLAERLSESPEGVELCKQLQNYLFEEVCPTIHPHCH